MNSTDWQYYRPRFPVKARQVFQEEELHASRLGQAVAIEHWRAGDYLVEDRSGRFGIAPREDFERDYEVLRLPPLEIERILNYHDQPQVLQPSRVLSNDELAAIENDIAWRRMMNGTPVRAVADAGQLSDTFRYQERAQWRQDQVQGSNPSPSNSSLMIGPSTSADSEALMRQTLNELSQAERLRSPEAEPHPPLHFRPSNSSAESNKHTKRR